MSVGDVGVVVLSSLTRTQSRVSATPPAGSHGKVETTASLLSFQIASVGRSSTANWIWAGNPGCLGAGGESKLLMTASRSRVATEVTPPPAGVPVIRAYAMSPSACSATANTVGLLAGVWNDGRQLKTVGAVSSLSMLTTALPISSDQAMTAISVPRKATGSQPSGSALATREKTLPLATTLSVDVPRPG